MAGKSISQSESAIHPAHLCISRYPIWLWPQVITMFMVLGATLSNDYSTFTAFRSLQGLFGTVPQVIGLPIIHDMYSPEQWPRMINIW